MSGSGGFNKYRCKYWATYECDKWVLVRDKACPWCVAQGRDDDGMTSEQPLGRPLEVCVPVVHEGTISYTIMELVRTGQPGNYWALRRKMTQQPLMPTFTTSDTPGVVLPTTGIAAYQVYQR